MGIFFFPLSAAIDYLANLGVLLIVFRAARKAPWKALAAPGALSAWDEAFLTKFLLTIFTVYRPQWVMTFNDGVYLRGR